jgi:hypothetical protein
MTEPRACDVLFGGPQANQDTAPAPAPPVESVAEKFFRVAEPKPAPAFMRSPEAAAAEAATIADLEALGVKVPDGVTLSPAQRIQLHDASMKAQREDQDAQVASWEAEARKLPPADVEAAQAFAREHLDDELRDVLMTSGLGSHPGIVRLAAKLARR